MMRRRSGTARGRSWTWFVAFQAAALIPVLLVGIGLYRQYQQQRTSETLRDARTQAMYIGDLAIGPALPPGDLTTVSPQAAQVAVTSVLARPAIRGHVLRIKIWDRSGRIVASDSPELVGVRFPLESEVRTALTGSSDSDITQLTARENVEERRFGTAVEAYVPLHSADPAVVTGVLEIYLPYEPLASDLRHGERVLAVHLAFGLGGIVVALGLLTTAITALLRRRTARALHLADHDALTGLLSRSAFEERLADLVARGRPAAVVLADLDDFKRVNDALGQAAGDALLQHVAAALLEAAPDAVVARIGGDEFAVLLPGIATALDAEAALTRLHDTLCTETEIAGVPVSAAASLGAVLFPGQCSTATGLLQCADRAMYAAKPLTSGNALYDPSREAFDATRLQLLADLRRAVPAGQLVLHYQPQARTADLGTVAVEALLRWQHPQLGLVPPDDFLPLAEGTGLIVQITRWVLDAACAQLAAWTRGGLDLACSVNVSARDLADPGLLAAALQATQRYGLPPYRLCLELTETAILEDPARARDVLTALSGAGFGLSLDDFGQGYTSLGQLRDLPLDEIKVDRSFVAGMADNSADRAVVATVLQLGHSVGLRVVAEGVETAEQAACLQALGYDVLQGWHIGRPGPADQIEVRARTAAS